MSAVIAQCPKGHKWKADRTTLFNGKTVSRVVMPKKCPVCQREWIVTTEDKERRTA